LGYSEDPNSIDVSYISFKDPKKYRIKEMQAQKTITLNVLDKFADLTDLPCGLVLDFDKDKKLIGLEIIGNVIPYELKN